VTIEFSPGNAESAWERIATIGMVRKGVTKGISTAIAPKRRGLEVPGGEAGVEAVAEGGSLDEDGSTAAEIRPSIEPSDAASEAGAALASIEATAATEVAAPPAPPRQRPGRPRKSEAAAGDPAFEWS
jgi:hypothetical protein